MKISIIIATLNAGPKLQEALDSIFGQSYRDLEVLVADGGSVDGTVSILTRISDPRLVWWASEKDSGIYSAWNKAIKRVSGDWVLFLGADDQLWNRDVLAKFASKSSLFDEFKILYGVVACVDSEGKLWKINGDDWIRQGPKFRQRAIMLPHQGVFHKASIFRSGILFDESYKISGDYDFLLGILKCNDPLFLGDLIVAKMASGGVSGGLNNESLHFEGMRARLRHGYPDTIWVILLKFRYRIRWVMIYFFGEAVAANLYDYIRLIFGKPRMPR